MTVKTADAVNAVDRGPGVTVPDRGLLWGLAAKRDLQGMVEHDNAGLEKELRGVAAEVRNGQG